MFDPRTDIRTCCHLAASAAFPHIQDTDTREKFEVALEKVARAVLAEIERNARRSGRRVG